MKEINIVSISDLHGFLPSNLPEGDILTICGDICPVKGSHSPTTQIYWLNNHFIPWISELVNSNKFKHAVFITGNHDFVFNSIHKNNNPLFTLNLPENIHYLFDNEITIEDVRIYGTPWTPTFGNWAFMHNEAILNNIFMKIPEGIDILLTHGPAYGYNDTILQYPERINGEQHIGSTALERHIKRAKPKWLLAGHIHSGSHSIEKCLTDYMDLSKYINCVNVSIMDEDYNPTYDPFEFSVIKE